MSSGFISSPAFTAAELNTLLGITSVTADNLSAVMTAIAATPDNGSGIATESALEGVIATVAPRLAAALGQKLAAQAVPVLGAVSGAALNAAFLRYYREVARIRFALMRLAVQHGGAAVAARFAEATAAPRLTRNR